MKLFSYNTQNFGIRMGISLNDVHYDVFSLGKSAGMDLPRTMLDFLKGGQVTKNSLEIISGKIEKLNPEPLKLNKIQLTAPVHNPPSCRDAYAFRQHVETARKNRGMPMIPEFDQFPIFYFTNHNAIMGPGDVVLEKDHFEKLDFELELAIVIGKQGRNIPAEEADEYIAGFTIMNDLSARHLQMEEMKLNLGPAKGKDFSTVIGPYLVTPEELQSRAIPTDKGLKYDLKMTAEHNGKRVSQGNASEMNWTFAEIIERCSYGADIFPGDVIGSGTVGTGCYLELNGTAALEASKNGRSITPTWLQNGDSISLTIDGLGTLSNKMVLSENDVSILEKKKESVGQNV